MPIAITGIGLQTPLGKTASETWTRLLDPDLPAVSGGRVPGLSEDSEGLTRAERMANMAVREALADAQLSDFDSERMGCAVSASKPLYVTEPASAPGERWPLTPGTFAPAEIITHRIARSFGLHGERRSVIAACATGVHSLAMGAQWIEMGLCDMVVTGSVEPFSHPLYAAGFSQMGVLSSEKVMRPFSGNRSGFVFGEGAGILILESLAHAVARGVKPYATVSGWALGADGHSSVAFNSDGKHIAHVAEKALHRAGRRPADVDVVNVHGTATRLNDWIEGQALRTLFRNGEPLLTATKSATGHLLGAAGSVEAALTALTVRYGQVPPTRHLIDPEPELQFSTQMETIPVRHALSLSFGFGGPIGAVLLSACS